MNGTNCHGWDDGLLPPLIPCEDRCCWGSCEHTKLKPSQSQHFSIVNGSCLLARMISCTNTNGTDDRQNFNFFVFLFLIMLAGCCLDALVGSFLSLFFVIVA